jgi:hypothetical protein
MMRIRLLHVMIFGTSFARAPCTASVIDESGIVNISGDVNRKNGSLFLQDRRRVDQQRSTPFGFGQKRLLDGRVLRYLLPGRYYRHLLSVCRPRCLHGVLNSNRISAVSQANDLKNLLP